MNRHDIERRRLQRIIDNPAVSDFEREDARNRLDPICRHCEKRVSSHNDAKCPVLARFQQRNGKGLFPTPDQAAKVREAIARDDAEKVRADRRKDLKAAQQKLF